MAIYKILAFVSVSMGIVAQLCLKKGMLGFRLRRNLLKNLLRIYLNPYVILGAFLFLISMAIFIVAISSIDLSYAYPLASLNFVFVSIFSKYLFKEKISRLRWISLAIIIFGVALLSIS
ncbi:MAG: EamA family transporter [Nanoarchaeota archaeon]|nr:EamA family transporter [Nanoarchaeota archaeon]